MIEEEEINHETTPDKPRRDRIDSGTTALTKRGTNCHVGS